MARVQKREAKPEWNMMATGYKIKNKAMENSHVRALNTTANGIMILKMDLVYTRKAVLNTLVTGRMINWKVESSFTPTKPNI